MRICSSCFDEQHISKFIRKNGQRNQCSMCKDSWGRPISAKCIQFDSLAEFLWESLSQSYEEVNPDNIPWDPEDKEYISDGLSFSEVLEEEGVECRHSKIFEQLDLNSATNFIYENQYTGDYHDYFSLDHHTRDACASYLKTFIETFKIIKQNKLLNKEVSIFRIRCLAKNDTWEPNAKNLGSPPQTESTDTRYGPGFYGALEINTAIRETIPNNDEYHSFVIGRWEIPKAIKVSYLVPPKKLPSIFDRRKHGDRDMILNYRKFIRTLNSKNITHYNITQSISEGLDNSIIIYPSSKLTSGNCIYFPHPHNCLDNNQPHLKNSINIILKEHQYIRQKLSSLG